MNKIFLIVVLVVFSVSGSAFASETFTSTGAAGTPNGVLSQYRTSTNVTLVVTSIVSNYSAVSSHLNGDRVFGSGSDDAVLYRLTAGKTAGTAYTTAPGNSEAFASGGTWTSL